MSRGLGKIQRTMLFVLARHEVWLAELARQQQRPYRSPDRWSLFQLTYALAGSDEFYDRALRWQRVGWALRQFQVREFEKGNPAAREHMAALATISNRTGKNLLPTKEEEFKSRPLDYLDIQGFNPSRTILGLEKHGLVLRDHYRRFRNLALTRTGFAEARRLGGVEDSEIVDLDRMQDRWRKPDEFLLGIPVSETIWMREDGPERIKMPRAQED
jgi:hypothetical protein